MENGSTKKKIKRRGEKREEGKKLRRKSCRGNEPKDRKKGRLTRKT
jgi:hypothetical protein